MAKKQKKDPVPIKQTEATRKSASDFGEATTNAKRIRVAFSPLIERYGDNDIINRLNGIMVKALLAIPSTMAGKRKFADGNMSLLRGFRFYDLQSLRTLWAFHPAVKLRLDGLTFELSKFHSPVVKGATHIVFQLMVVNIDLNGEADEIAKAKDLTLPVKQKLKPVKINIPLNLNGNRALFIAVGVHHLDKQYIMPHERSFASEIVYAERIKDGNIVDFVFAEEAPDTPKPKTDDGIEWEGLEDG